jgi:hypothetical protein
MIKGLCSGVAVLLLGAAGCSQTNQSARRYSAPIFDTKPRPTATAVHRPVPPPIPGRLPVGGPGWIPPGGISDRWTEIVLHHSGAESGNAAAFDAYHRNVNHWDELGYHFVIGNGQGSPDGAIEVGPRWRKQKHGAHCKTPNNHFNDHGIGICLVGNFDRTYPTAAQRASLNRLLTFLTAHCHIPVTRITTHKDVTHKTACPGKHLNLAAVRQQVSGSARAYSRAR